MASTDPATHLAGRADAAREWAARLGEERSEALPAEAEELLRPGAPAAATDLRRLARALGTAPAPPAAEEEPSRLAERLEALIALGGPELLVPEPAGLEPAGSPVAGRNVDAEALDLFEVLVALDRAGGLVEELRSRERSLVWEIGGGWGGLAHRVKALCPRVTYLMSDAPEALVAPAAYLAAAFPDATVRFLGADAAEGRFEDWEEVDFAFLPLDHAEHLRFERLDLLLSLHGLLRLEPERRAALARRAHTLGARFVHAAGERSAREALAPRFWLPQAPVVPAFARTVLTERRNEKLRSVRPPAGARRAFRLEHDLGWRRAEGPGAGREDGVGLAVAAPPAPPRVVIGMLTYNRVGYVREALESILVQTHEDFALVILDDGSSDGTAELVESYARRDPRVHFEQNAQKLGVVQNWRRALRVGRERHPSAEFFAWATDHDVWHPRWLAALFAEIERHPEVVLVYPYRTRIEGDGEVLQLPWIFETHGIAGRAQRLSVAVRGMAAGDMIYGIYRIEPLVRAGVYRAVVGADRLLLAELSLHGQYKQVPEMLWFRRFRLKVTSDRQRHLYFPQKVPLYMYLPWWAMHSGALFFNLAVRGTSRPEVGRLEGAAMAGAYLLASLRHDLGRQYERRLRRVRRAGVRAARRVPLLRRGLWLVRHRRGAATATAPAPPDALPGPTRAAKDPADLVVVNRSYA